MSFDLHEPVSSARAAAHPAAERAVDLAPSVESAARRAGCARAPSAGSAS